MDNNFEEALEPVVTVEDEMYPVATEDVIELTEDDSLGTKIAKIAVAALTAVLTVIGGLTVVKWLKNKIKTRKAKKEAAPAVEAKVTPIPVAQDAEQPETKEETPATEQKPETK